MEATRPQTLNIWINICAEAYLGVGNTEFLCMDPTMSWKLPPILKKKQYIYIYRERETYKTHKT